MKSLQRQQGFGLIAALVIIVVLGGIIAVVARLVTTDATAHSQQNDAQKALNIANAGLHRALFAMTTVNPSLHVSCANLSSQFSNVSFGQGEYSVTGASYNPKWVTLSGNVSTTSTIIPLNTLTDVAPYGQIKIDNELINYTGTSQVATVCGGSPQCLTGVTRGAYGSKTQAHSLGTDIVQNQCEVTSVGSVPNATNPQAKRTVSAMVAHQASAWTVGDDNNGELIGRWNSQAWVRQAPSSGILDTDLNAVYALNESDVWAVGDAGTFINWDGQQWVNGSVSRAGQDAVPYTTMSGVYCNHRYRCWAVGNDNGGMPTIAWINDGTRRWYRFVDNMSGLPSRDLYAVTCSSLNDCWAVGQARTFLHWNGTQWSQGNIKTSGSGAIVSSRDFYSVSCPAGNDCWAVARSIGTQLGIAHWDGSQWQMYTGTTIGSGGSFLRGVSCTSTSNCWIVGSNVGGYAQLWHWNGANWSREPSSNLINVPDQDFYSVDCADNSCWAVGQGSSIIDWNGKNWHGNLQNDLLPENRTLRSVSIVAPTVFTEPNKALQTWKQK